MKQHVAHVMMLLAAVCDATVQTVEASYSDRLSENEGALSALATRSISLWPAQRIASERGRGGTGPAGAHATVTADIGDRYVTLDTLGMAPRGGSQPVCRNLRYDGRSTPIGGAVYRTLFELFGVTPFADGHGALSAWDSNSWRNRLDGVRFETEPGAVSVATAAPASLARRYGSDRAAAPGATATIFSSPGAVLLSAIGVALIGRQRRKTLF